MAVETRRSCGYRKVGGLYLMGSGAGMPCDRLPIPLTVCPCCSQGIKQTRGWTWIDVAQLVGGIHRNCADEFPCPLCMATEGMGRAGMLWIGEKFYRTPAEFLREAERMGISRRIATVPRGFEVGKTWVLLAHPQAAICPTCQGSGLVQGSPCACRNGRIGGLFRVFKPHAVEKIITQTQSADATLIEELRARGITPVIVPDDDKDHQGSVWDDAPEAEE